MYLAYMKNKTTAQNYAKGLCYLFPKQNWKKTKVDTSEKKKCDPGLANVISEGMEEQRTPFVWFVVV